MPLVEYTNPEIDFFIESEAWYYKLRLFDKTGATRVGSIDIGTTGLKTARACDLNMIHPHKVTRELIEAIKTWLIEVGGYENVVFERYKNGIFLSRTVELQGKKVDIHRAAHTQSG